LFASFTTTLRTEQHQKKAQADRSCRLGYSKNAIHTRNFTAILWFLAFHAANSSFTASKRLIFY